LCTDDAIAAVETRSEHVHASALPTGDPFTASQELSDDGLYTSATHVRKSVASVRGNDGIIPLESMFDAN
jgi:hypothetical protein